MNRAAARIQGLYGLADAGFLPAMPMEQKVRAFLDGGASAVQVRMKHAPAAALLDAARQAVALAAGRALIFVNDRPDVALAAGADGVHVGDDDLPVRELRRVFGARLLIGRTVRTLEDALMAAEDGADYVGFGPVYPTQTKQVSVAARGVAELARCAVGAPVPVVAIAGITLDRVPELAQAGAAAVAVVSDVLGDAAPAERARQFVETFAEARAAAAATRSSR